MKIENLSKAIKLYENYQALDNLLYVIRSNKCNIKISAMNAELGSCDLGHITITSNSDSFNKIIDIIRIKRDSIGDEIDKL